jgi:hypothetical protein
MTIILKSEILIKMSNRIGKRGENIFATIISRNVASKGFLLDPTFLGDKFPTVDFHVDLLQYPHKAFFYASVKTTTLGYYPDDEKIKITIGKEEVAELSKFPIPVYIFGIDETKEKGFLISANNLNTSLNINGIPTKFPITGAVLELLWKEVADYWDNSRINTKFVSSFN